MNERWINPMGVLLLLLCSSIASAQPPTYVLSGTLRHDTGPDTYGLDGQSVVLNALLTDPTPIPVSDPNVQARIDYVGTGTLQIGAVTPPVDKIDFTFIDSRANNVEDLTGFAVRSGEISYMFAVFFDPTANQTLVPPPTYCTFNHANLLIPGATPEENAIYTIVNPQLSATPRSCAECTVQVTRTTYGNGDDVVVSKFQIANIGTVPVPIELKIWLRVPGLSPVSLVNAGGDGSLILPVGFDYDPDPYTLFQVAPGHPRGAYELGCRSLDPVTGKVIAEGAGRFWIE